MGYGKLIILVLCVNLGLFSMGLTSELKGFENILEGSPEVGDDLTFNLNNTDVDFGSSGVQSGSIFTTLFLGARALGIFAATITLPWVVLNMLDFPDMIVFVFGTILFVLNWICIVAVATGRGSLTD